MKPGEEMKQKRPCLTVKSQEVTGIVERVQVDKTNAVRIEG